MAPLPKARGWNQGIFKVPSSPKHSIILCFCDRPCYLCSQPAWLTVSFVSQESQLFLLGTQRHSLSLLTKCHKTVQLEKKKKAFTACGLFIPCWLFRNTMGFTFSDSACKAVNISALLMTAQCQSTHLRVRDPAICHKIGDLPLSTTFTSNHIYSYTNHISR